MNKLLLLYAMMTYPLGINVYCAKIIGKPFLCTLHLGLHRTGPNTTAVCRLCTLLQSFFMLHQGATVSLKGTCCVQGALVLSFAACKAQEAQDALHNATEHYAAHADAEVRPYTYVWL